ncbi:MAG: sulfotransferase [Gammaproteobacteria bacterium]|nr:sulfotransferase [Gammaproteobacteria bacterium]MBT8094959.1 sulfotransferase [Gammaproteobacteria bacterium]MBT8105440.1 sulfotransferase [Gammaproteobacteria bacterium]NNK25454.1 tetratricopeptide repeat protein [Woeseiaceae bacterium]
MSQSPPLTIREALSRAKKASKRGDNALAAQLFSAVLRQQPDHPVAKKAIRKLQRAASKQAGSEPAPREMEALIHAYNAGHLEAAEKSCRRLLGEFPQSALVNNLLGSTLQSQGRFDEAVKAFDEAIRARPDFAEAYSNRGNALKGLGRFADSVGNYDKAITLKPDFADAYYNRANALKDLGELDAAIASYENALRLRPDLAPAHRNLSALKTYEEGDAQIEILERLLSGERVPGRTELCFAAAKAYEDIGQYEKSFDRLEEGNRLRGQELGYNIDADRQLFAELRDMFAGEAPAAVEPQEPAAVLPIFIVGMMRSGTSLVEQILATHDAVHGAGELETMNHLVVPTLPRIDSDAVRRGYLESLDALGVSEKVVTDKMPMNFRWLGHILTALPEAKVVHVQRDATATCWSIYKHYFPDEGHGYGCDLRDLAEYYRLYEDLMAFWRERFRDRICDLSYEALTENQEQGTRNLLAYCGLDWQESCLDFHRTKRRVRTLSATQVRREMYQGSSQAWRRYEDRLRPLTEALER